MLNNKALGKQKNSQFQEPMNLDEDGKYVLLQRVAQHALQIVQDLE